MTLYHYSCAHAKPRIEDELVIKPGGLLVPPGVFDALDTATRMIMKYVWLTDIPNVSRRNGDTHPGAIGFDTNYLTNCDRTEFRWQVEQPSSVFVQRWAQVRHIWPTKLVAALERVEDAQPDHWFVSQRQLTVQANVRRTPRPSRRKART